MTNLLLLFICLLAGVGLRRLKAMPRDAHLALNQIILYVPLPALILVNVPQLEWNPDLLALPLVPWLLFLLALVFFPFVGKKLGWDRSTIGCLILTAGLGNTAFVGYPVIEVLFGGDSVKYAILLDQPGTFLIVSTLGIYVAALYSAGPLPTSELMKKVLTFPPFVSFALALVLGLEGWEAEGVMKEILERLAAILTPLALISVGLQLAWSELRDEFRFLAWGLGFKLILSPLIICCVYLFLGLERKVFEIAVMEAAMATMITAGIVASTHNLRPALSGMMVGLGVPLSFLTLGCWYFLLKFL